MKGDCEPGSTGTCEIEGVGTFEASDDLTVVQIDSPLEGYSRSAVTIEPTGGSPQPTSNPIIDSAAA